MYLFVCVCTYVWVIVSEYVCRCIKPNAAKKPMMCDSDLFVGQLHCLSILEAIALQHAGFAYREVPEVSLKTHTHTHTHTYTHTRAECHAKR